MKDISKEEKQVFLKNMSSVGRAKSKTRIHIDKMKVGETTIFEKGVDYKQYRSVYYATRDVTKKTGAMFFVSSNQEKTEVLVERTV